MSVNCEEVLFWELLERLLFWKAVESVVPSSKFGLQNLLEFLKENKTGNQIKQLNNTKARRKETENQVSVKHVNNNNRDSKS